MRNQISKIWMENEQISDERMANELGYCIGAYNQKIRDEEQIERDLTHLPIRIKTVNIRGESVSDMCKRDYYQKKNAERRTAEKWWRIQRTF